MAISSANETHQCQFCALEYRPLGWNTASSKKAAIVLLVLKGEDESIRLFVHPEIRTIVQEEDLAYIEALLLDFPERAKQHPEEFFKQILSLGVGPLVAQEEESNLSFMQKLVSQFSQISTTTG